MLVDYVYATIMRTAPFIAYIRLSIGKNNKMAGILHVLLIFICFKKAIYLQQLQFTSGGRLLTIATKEEKVVVN